MNHRRVLHLPGEEQILYLAKDLILTHKVVCYIDHTPHRTLAVIRHISFILYSVHISQVSHPLNTDHGQNQKPEK